MTIPYNDPSTQYNGASTPYGGASWSPNVFRDRPEDRYSIELRDRQGRLTRIFKKVTAASWNYDRIGGCGAFQFGIKEQFDALPLSAWGDYDVQFKFAPADGSCLYLWYRGYIDKTDAFLQDKETVSLSGFGYVRQLERVIVSRNYQNKTVEGIVTDILDSFVLPDTQITYDPADIESTGIVAASIAFNTSADEAIKTLADLVGLREWGVDRNLNFFFKRRHDYPKRFVFIKKDVQQLNDGRSFDEIKNSFHLQGKSGFTYALEQSESISLWGRRGAIIVNSSITNATDAEQYLDAVMFETAKPRRQLRVDVPDVSAPVEDALPLGKIQFMGEDLQGTLFGEKFFGEHLFGAPYQSQMNSIQYRITIGGVTAAIRAAYLPPQIGKSLKQIDYELSALREV